jgi:succinate dehydrogenase / fumarate reductase, membrane anchor subunit
MQYLTARKRAEGLGAGHTGTANHWAMTKSSAALLILIPLFVFTFGQVLGQPHDSVLAYYSRPFPALIAGLTFLVAMLHLKDGMQTMIEDYLHGTKGRLAILIASGLCYAIAATGVFAVLRLAL